MKIIIVVASKRKGSSRYVAEKLEKVLNSKDVKIIQLSDYKIEYCTGCLECDETHKCNIEDGMAELLEEVKIADILIFITPTRYSLLSGDCKVFIDRLNPTAVSGDIEQKNFIAIAVGQTEKDENPDSVNLATKSLVSFADNAEMNILGEYSIYGCYDRDDIKQNKDVERVCEEIALKIQDAENRYK